MIYLICLPGVGNLLNAVLDLILIYYFHIGIGGAAVATVISEYVDDVVKLLQWFLLLTSPKLYSSTISISLFLLKKKHSFYLHHTKILMYICTHFIRYLIALILLLKLNDKVLLVTPNIDGPRLARYLKSGILQESLDL